MLGDLAWGHRISVRVGTGSPALLVPGILGNAGPAEAVT